MTAYLKVLIIVSVQNNFPTWIEERRERFVGDPVLACIQPSNNPVLE